MTTNSTASYRLTRMGIRARLALKRRSLRLLGAERLPESAAILYVCHPADFDDALVLIAALERPVACLAGRPEIAERPSMVESALGMIAVPGDGSSDGPLWHAALRSCTAALAAGALVLVFSQWSNSGQPNHSDTALKLACEAWASAFPEHLPVVMPAHRFRPEVRRQEILIHFGDPVRLDAGEDPALVEQQVRAALAEVHNVFSLDAALLNRLMHDVERDLRDRLQQQWSSRPGRPRQTDGFRLSPFAAETLRRANRIEPESLVALNELAQAEREARRESALAQLRAEIEVKQFSAVQRIWGWAETGLGFPIALYGAVNHLMVAILLLAGGLLKRDTQLLLGRWIARGLIVLGCYAGQVALADHFFGRAGAGYYAVTLPLSGAYLARFIWLIQRRTRVLMAGTRSTMLQTLADRNRGRFFEKLDNILVGGH